MMSSEIGMLACGREERSWDAVPICVYRYCGGKKSKAITDVGRRQYSEARKAVRPGTGVLSYY